MGKIQRENKLQITVEGAIITALAMGLSYLPHSAGISGLQFQYGLIPMAIYALRRGVVPGTLAGLTWGILDLILRGIGNGGVLNVFQGFLEYPVAFAVIGIAGIRYLTVRNKLLKNDNVSLLIILYSSLGVIIKYFIHFIAGGFYWGMYAPKTMNPWIYSLIVNGGSAVINVLLIIIVTSLLSKSMKLLLIPKK